MVLETLSLIIGLVGFGWAGWKDLRTTEFPDWLPYSLIAAAVGLRAAFSFLQADFSLLTSSLFVGLPFLGFGLLLYYSRQWGDGDAWLLGAMGFLFPDGRGFPSTQIPFPLVLLFNFFFVAFFYIVAYSLAVGVRSGQMGSFFRGFKGEIGRVAGVAVAFALALAGLFLFLNLSQNFYSLFLFPPLLFFLLVFLHYGRFVEGRLFRKRISVRQLREGDVPLGEKWRVLKKKEIQQLRKRGGKIWIKEGVRFSPVFFLVLLVLLLFGNVLNLFALV